MLANSELFEFLSQLPEEALAAVVILSMVFVFITTLVTVLSAIESHKSITLARMSKEMIEDLLAKGYTPQEIEPLVHGTSGWKKMKKLFSLAKEKAYHSGPYGRPTPPVKEPV